MTGPDGGNRRAVFASDRPQVFGHRGAAGLAPENTMRGVAAGLAAGADGCECDVRLSADGVAVVIHDPTLERTTDATGAVRHHTAAALARVDATCRFRSADRRPAPVAEGVPTFAEVLAAFPEARLIVELKDDDPRLADVMVGLVRGDANPARVCLGSFHAAVLERVRRLAPDITTSGSLPEARGVLVRSYLRWPSRGPRPFRALQVPQTRGRLRVVSPAFVRQVHREGCLVQVWTVNTADEVRRLLAIGVDGIISDRPDIAVAARDAAIAGQ